MPVRLAIIIQAGKRLTLLDLVKQGDVSLLFAHDPVFALSLLHQCFHMQILDIAKVLVERRQLVEVGREQAECSDFGGNVSVPLAQFNLESERDIL